MKETQSGRILPAIVALLNVCGLACLVYFLIPYVTHNTSVPHPDAMLPSELWDTAGMALTLGLMPLLAVNLWACMIFRKRVGWLRWLFLIPGAVCLVAVLTYWCGALL